MAEPIDGNSKEGTAAPGSGTVDIHGDNKNEGLTSENVGGTNSDGTEDDNNEYYGDLETIGGIKHKFVAATGEPMHATVVDAPTHLNLAANSFCYDRRYDIEEIPDLSGANSIFNPFSSFKYYPCSDGIIGPYNPNRHYDVGINREALNSVKDKYDEKQKLQITYNADYTESDASNAKDFSISSWENIKALYYNTYTNVTYERDVLIDIMRDDDRPTAENIIKRSQNVAPKSYPVTFRMPYSWNDFLYCKWYGKIPNNRLITLRRFSFPVDDLATNHHSERLVPIAQALTYFGEGTGNNLSQLLKMQWGLNWQELESTVQTVDGNERGWGAGVEGWGKKFTAISGHVAAFARGAGVKGTTANVHWDGSGKVYNNWLKKMYSDEGAYWNVVMGPVNVVHKTHRRERGFKWQNDITIKFTYSLRSYYGINPRVAAIDIMTNMLRLTNNNGKWWGGAMRYFPNMQDQVSILGDQESLYNGNYEKYFKSVRDELLKIGKSLMSRADSLVPPDMQALKQGDIKGFMESCKEMLKSMWSSFGKEAASMALGKLAGASRPELLSIRNLLEGRPVGEWHLVIGNPLNPIAVMGNMLVDSCDFEVNDTLGADDFPTELSFSVKLKHARPREIGDIESMFNMGMGRMSYTPLIPSSSEHNTFGPASTETQSSDKDAKSKYMTQLRKLRSEGGTNNGGRNSDTTSSESNPNDVIDYIANAYVFNSTSIKQKIRYSYGNAWADSNNLSVIIDKTRLKN